MLKIFSILLFSLYSFNLYADKIAYSVDDTNLIFTSHIENRMRLLKALGVGNVSEKQVVDDLIKEALISNVIAKSGMELNPDKEVEEKIVALADQNDMTEDFFAETLERQGTSKSEFKKYLKNQILQNTVISGLASNVPKIGQNELENIIRLNQNNLNVEIKTFSTVNKDRKSFEQLLNFRKKIVNYGCNLDKPEKNNNITITSASQNISEFKDQLPTIIRDLSEGQVSSIFEYKDKLNFIVLCKSNIMELSNNNEAKNISTNTTNFNKLSKVQDMLDLLKKNSIIKKY